jgi:hypothetical protein
VVWVQRTDAEIAQWHNVTRRDARSHALGIAALVWAAVSVLAASGLHYSRLGVVIQRSFVGGFWGRFLIFAVGALPISHWIYRVEMRKEIDKSIRRTICPACDRGGDAPAGTKCDCGQVIVPSSMMKWVDD